MKKITTQSKAIPFAKKPNSGFADFFLHASEAEMQEVIAEAARRANEDQRSLIEKINTLDHKAT